MLSNKLPSVLHVSRIQVCPQVYLYSSTTCRLPRHEVHIIYSIYLRSCIACDSSVSIYKYLEIRQTGKRQMVK